MSVLDRAALDESPLADLHTIASELSIDGYRRLRRADLTRAIIERQGGSSGGREEPAGDVSREELAPDASGEEPAADAGREEPAGDASGEEPGDGRRRRGRRGARSRAEAPAEGDPVARSRREKSPESRPTERSRGQAPREEDAPGEDRAVEGVVELLPNGSGFLRVSPPEPSDEDVYISAAQVKRCELVGGDRVGGPLRPPRRSERFPSLVRIETINGRPAAEVAEGARFDDLPAGFPRERFRLGSEDPTIKAIEWLTPIGKGSRVTIVGGSWAGKTEALRRLAGALASHEDLELSVVLAGVRPEEITEWGQDPVEPAGAVSFAASADAQAAAVERVVDQARRVAARGSHAVVLIDTLDGLHPAAARKALAAARNILDGGSLTVIATAAKPLGGETTVIALDPALTSTGRFPALDLVASGTTRAELLLGEAGAQAIALARAEAMME